MDRYEAHDFIRQIRALHKYHGHALRPAVRNEMGSGLGAIQKFLDVLHGAHLVFRRVHFNPPLMAVLRKATAPEALRR
jgi:hypothetical protein